MARLVDCPCGHTLTGKDDAELFVFAKQHVKEHHSEAARSDAEIRELVTAMAKDA